MKQFLLTLCILFAPGLVAAEYINSYEVVVDLKADSSFEVSEEIDYRFTDGEKHGIFRVIPTTHPGESSAWFKTRYVDVDVTGVLLNGNAVPYEIDERSDELYLKIGDPNKYVEGSQVYTFTYTVRGGLLYEDGLAEFYWNILGTDWDVPVLALNARLSAPADLMLEERACYQDIDGGKGSCTELRVDDGAVVFGGRELGVGEGVTIAQALDSTQVEKVVFEKNKLLLFWIGGIIAWLFGLISFVRNYFTKHKPNVPEIAMYAPYQDYKPMYAGVLFDGRLDPQDITAAIVYLAQQGFLKITATEKKVLFFFDVTDYEVALLRPTTEAESDFLKDILSLLFADGAAVGTKITLGELKKDMAAGRRNQLTIQSLERDIKADMLAAGFIEAPDPMLTKRLIGILVLALVIGAAGLMFDLPTAVLGIAGLALVTAIVGLLVTHRRSTAKGYEAKNHTAGFIDFLSMTEKDRYAFHNAPSKNPEQFMEYLPYAIAFGVEKEWADVFKDISIPAPNWYAGAAGTNFSSSDLTSSLGAFSSSFATSSGTSASSGGGSSGGGGGGGGGGSW